MALSRRDLIKTGVFAGAALSLPLTRVASGQSAFANRMPTSKLPKPFTVPFARAPFAVPVRTTGTTDYYHIESKMISGEILPGFKTMLFSYGGSVPGPVIKATRGREVVVRHWNNLPAVHPTLGYEPWTSVHLHGGASLPQYDGYASDVTLPGQFKDYHYANEQPARTMWYHDHGIHHTAENAYHGLAAQYHIHDPLEQSLGIPQGEFDVAMMLSDAMFNNDGSLLFTLANQNGLWGDVMLVNGRPWPVMQVKRRKYRFRLCAAALSRSFGLSLDSGDPLVVIATDGGLMPAPVSTKTLRMMSGERYEIIIDFSKYAVGQRIVLKNTSPSGVNKDYVNTDKMMAFDVVGDTFDTANNNLPAVLNPADPVMHLREADAVTTRHFLFERKGGQWAINSTTWEEVEESNFEFVLASPRYGDTEIWEFKNSAGGWFHPAHVHLVDFRILSRNGLPPRPYEVGPKDVAYLGENETVRVLMKFEGRGKYMIHCHNLIHEDHDMMSQYEIIDPLQPGDDPMGTRATAYLPTTPPV